MSSSVTIETYFSSLLITNFENKLIGFQEGVLKNYDLSQKQFQKAIADINKSIKSLENTRDNLLKSNNNLSLIKAMPITGRTHQIRVHSKLAGYPILGDTKYGDFNFNSEMSRQGFKGLFLHAKSFNIKIQDKYFKFESHLPSSWDQILSIIEI